MNLRAWRRAGATRRRMLRRSALLAVLAATGCVDGPDAGSINPLPSERTAENEIGTAYADLHLEFVDAEGNSDKRAYLARVALCDEAGLGGSRLSEEDFGRLGTARAQVWSAPDRIAYRHERFRAPGGAFETGDRCVFELVSFGYHRYVDATRDASITFESGASASEPSPPAHVWNRGAAFGGDSPDTPKRSVAGVDCIEHPLPGGGTYCLWADGGAYGFDRTGSPLSEARGIDHLLDALVVEQTLGPSGHGIRARLDALVLDDASALTDMEPAPATAKPGYSAGGGR